MVHGMLFVLRPIAQVVIGADKAFDSSDSTYWRSSQYSTTDYEELKIVFPPYITILPTQIRLKAQRIGNSSKPAKIQGYIDGTWETLVDNITISSNTTNTYNVSTNKFYTQFRLASTNSSTSYYKRVDDLKIVSGTIRIENK